MSYVDVLSSDTFFVKDRRSMMKDRRGDQRGGEWEPIKIPHGIWPISLNPPESTQQNHDRQLKHITGLITIRQHALGDEEPAG
jgi:hypothetical protein